MSGMTTVWFLGMVMGGAIAFWANCAFCTLCSSEAIAQITPDGTLPNNSIVTPDGNTLNITGGTQAGGNLFHSFGEFSVPTSSTAFFNNVTDIQNIFSRVTGGSVSNIDGIIRASGTANLFLINPNGIIFGQNARLDIGGSFVGSTASSLKFADGTEFNAKASQTTPLLTISVPIGLQFGETAKQIHVNGPGQSLDSDGLTASFDSSSGFQVLPGKTLALVGGNVSLDGGILQAPGGQVELGGLASSGTVELNVNSNNLYLSFPDGMARANVSLTNRAGINVVAAGGGSIAVNAQNLDLLGGSRFSAGIGEGLGSVSSQAGDITLNADAVRVEQSSGIENFVKSNAIGNGGNINIRANSLSFTDGSRLISSTNGLGNAGRVTIEVNGSVSFQGGSSALTFTGGDAVGKGGDITIRAGSVSLRDGSGFLTSSSGQGDAGSVKLKIGGPVTFTGVDANGFPSGVFSNTEASAVGKGGDITVQASSLLLKDGAQLVTSAIGQGNAGSVKIETSDLVSFTGVDSVGVVSAIYSNVAKGAVGEGGDITIRANSLSLDDGALLNSNTQGQGNAGRITIVTNGSVSFAGVDEDRVAGGVVSNVGTDAIGKGGDVTIIASSLSLRDGARLLVSTAGRGDAGNVTVNVRDEIAFSGQSTHGRTSGAFSTVESGGVGKGGILDFAARSIRLDSVGAISAITASGDGGDIKLQVQDILLLRRNSNISTTAGIQGAGGNGGNITINAPSGFIVAVPRENSDISANAFTGRGGKVDITARSIFGIESRSRPTTLSDITASSERGVAGIVELNIPDVDLSLGLVELPTNLVDASQQIATACTPRARGNSFTVTGRGGLPSSPSEPLRSNAVITQWVTLDEETRSRGDRNSQPTPAAQPTTTTPQPIIEATGWVINDFGEVELVATTLGGFWQTPTDCSASKAPS